MILITWRATYFYKLKYFEPNSVQVKLSTQIGRTNYASNLMTIFIYTLHYKFNFGKLKPVLCCWNGKYLEHLMQRVKQENVIFADVKHTIYKFFTHRTLLQSVLKSQNDTQYKRSLWNVTLFHYGQAVRSIYHLRAASFNNYYFKCISAKITCPVTSLLPYNLYWDFKIYCASFTNPKQKLFRGS